MTKPSRATSVRSSRVKSANRTDGVATSSMTPYLVGLERAQRRSEPIGQPRYKTMSALELDCSTHAYDREGGEGGEDGRIKTRQRDARTTRRSKCRYDPVPALSERIAEHISLR